MPLYKARGIILRNYELGEADLLLTIYTREYGKKRVVANGVRRTKSRLSGSVMLFTDSSFLLHTGRTLDRIRQADINHSFPQLREGLEAMAYASYQAELVDKFVELEEENKRIFRLLLESFRLIAATEQRELVVRTFELQLLDLLGYRPHLTACLNCGQSHRGKQAVLGIDLGGLLCRNCRGETSLSWTLSAGSLKVLIHLQREGFRALRHLRPEAGMLREIAGFNRRYIDYRLEKKLESLAFLEMVTAKS